MAVKHLIIDERYQVFQQRDIREARAHALAGGIAVHLHCFVFPNSPQCFKAAVKRGEEIAHVFGQDADELKEIARAMGVRVLFIDKPGTASQHLDLCGAPLKKLLTCIGAIP